MKKITIYKYAPRLVATTFCLLPLSAAAMFDLGETVERDEELWEHLSETRHEVAAGIGYLSEESFMFGRFNGLTDDGLYLDLNVDLHDRPSHDADSMRYWRLRGRNLGLDSRSLRGEYGSQGSYSAFFDFRQMPHNQWQDVTSRYSGAGSHELVAGGERDIDIEQERQRFRLGGSKLLPAMDDRWRISADVGRETRDGTRLRGFDRSFASTPVWGPEVVDHQTDTYNVRLEYMGDQFQGSAAYHLSAFSQEGDSSMELSDADDHYALEPENTFHRFSFAGGYTLTPGSRVSGDLHIGRMVQDDGFVPAGEDVIRNGTAVTDLDGEIATTAFNLRGVHRLTDRLRLRAAIRYDDRDNDTDVFEVDGRETKPLSYTLTSYSVDADYRMGRRTRLAAGVERDERERDFGDRRETDETTVHARLTTTLMPGLRGGVRAAFSEQDGATYDSGDRTNDVPEALRNYDVADRDRTRVGGFAYYTPSFMPTVGLSLRADYIEDDYADSALGRTGAERFTSHAEVSWAPGADLSLYAFFGWELGEVELAGGDNDASWSADQEDTVSTVGLGGEWAFRPDEVDLGMEVIWVDTRSSVQFSNDDPVHHPALESTFTEIGLYGDYHVNRDLTVRGRYMYQRFSEDDWALTGESGIPDERDYSAHMVVASAIYRF